jgi:hypothetical protein
MTLKNPTPSLLVYIFMKDTKTFSAIDISDHPVRMSPLKRIRARLSNRGK